MAKALLLVWTNPTGPETEDEFNRWYDQTHIPQVKAAVPSITQVTRYRTAPPSHGGGPGQTPLAYLAVYELDSEDVETAGRLLNDGMVSGAVEQTTTLDVATTPPVMQWFTAL